MAAGDTYPLGDGTLHIGETGGLIDVSCLINNARVTASKDQDDPRTMLCGTVKQSKPRYTYTLTGNADIDIDDPDGLWALSQVAKGTEVDFDFTPNTDAGTEAAGVLVIDPMDFGGDEYGTTMNSDCEWTLSGEPTYTIGGVPLVTEAATEPEPEAQAQGEGEPAGELVEA